MEAQATAVPDELTTAEAHEMLRDLAGFGVPVVLFSGGEPLLRPDIFDLVDAARDLGMRAVLSSNGTLVTDEVAWQVRDAGVSYAGISRMAKPRTTASVAATAPSNGRWTASSGCGPRACGWACA